jgi:hypothetical protein
MNPWKIAEQKLSEAVAGQQFVVVLDKGQGALAAGPFKTKQEAEKWIKYMDQASGKANGEVVELTDPQEMIEYFDNPAMGDKPTIARKMRSN